MYKLPLLLQWSFKPQDLISTDTLNSSVFLRLIWKDNENPLILVVRFAEKSVIITFAIPAEILWNGNILIKNQKKFWNSKIFLSKRKMKKVLLSIIIASFILLAVFLQSPVLYENNVPQRPLIIIHIRFLKRLCK